MTDVVFNVQPHGQARIIRIDACQRLSMSQIFSPLRLLLSQRCQQTGRLNLLLLRTDAGAPLFARVSCVHQPSELFDGGIFFLPQMDNACKPRPNMHQHQYDTTHDTARQHLCSAACLSISWPKGAISRPQIFLPDLTASREADTPLPVLPSSSFSRCLPTVTDSQHEVSMLCTVVSVP